MNKLPSWWSNCFDKRCCIIPHALWGQEDELSVALASSHLQHHVHWYPPVHHVLIEEKKTQQSFNVMPKNPPNELPLNLFFSLWHTFNAMQLKVYLNTQWRQWKLLFRQTCNINKNSLLLPCKHQIRQDSGKAPPWWPTEREQSKPWRRSARLQTESACHSCPPCFPGRAGPWGEWRRNQFPFTLHHLAKRLVHSWLAFQEKKM